MSDQELHVRSLEFGIVEIRHERDAALAEVARLRGLLSESLGVLHELTDDDAGRVVYGRILARIDAAVTGGAK